MKWFTREWVNGDLPTSSDIDVAGAYEEHLASIWPSLPDAVRAFARTSDGRLSIHDAPIDIFAIDLRAGSLSMALLSGMQPEGYARLEIKLSQFKLLTPTLDQLTTVLSDPYTQFGYEEVDLRPGDDASPFEVRFIMFPRGELAFGFGSLDTSFEPLVDRSQVRARHLVQVTSTE